MVRTIKLNDGKEIPLIAWGTGTLRDVSGRETGTLGVKVLQDGIRHIDTAQEIYGTEEAVGRALAIRISREIRSGSLPSCTPKGVRPSPYQREPTEPQNQARARLRNIRKSVQGSLDRLGFKPDLLLIHNPYIPEKGKIAEYWQTLENLVEDGLLSGVSLGVSNFRPQDLEQVLEVAKIIPVVHQIEHHPYVLQHLQPLLDLGKKHNIVTEAFGALTPILRHPTGGPVKPILTRIAKRLTEETGKEVDEAGVLLLWHVAKGVVAITNSSNPSRIGKIGELDNIPELSKAEVEEIELAGRQIHYRYYKDHLTADFPEPGLPQDL